MSGTVLQLATARPTVLCRPISWLAVLAGQSRSGPFPIPAPVQLTTCLPAACPAHLRRRRLISMAACARRVANWSCWLLCVLSTLRCGPRPSCVPVRPRIRSLARTARRVGRGFAGLRGKGSSVLGGLRAFPATVPRAPTQLHRTAPTLEEDPLSGAMQPLHCPCSPPLPRVLPAADHLLSDAMRGLRQDIAYKPRNEAKRAAGEGASIPGGRRPKSGRLETHAACVTQHTVQWVAARGTAHAACMWPGLTSLAAAHSHMPLPPSASFPMPQRRSWRGRCSEWCTSGTPGSASPEHSMQHTLAACTAHTAWLGAKVPMLQDVFFHRASARVQPAMPFRQPPFSPSGCPVVFHRFGHSFASVVPQRGCRFVPPAPVCPGGRLLA